MSVKFFGVGGPNQIGSLKKTQKPSSDKKTDGVQTDKVEFSSVLQDVNKAQSINETQNAQRASRVAQLKAQVADGTYKPDLDNVASSLVQFLLQGK